MNQVPITAKTLGRAGLLPFVAAPLLMVTLPAYRDTIGEALGHYTFGIIIFLLGVWWGLGLIRRSAGPLMISNGIFLVTVAGRVLLTGPQFLALGAVLLGVMLVVERSHWLFTPQPGYYARLRVELTGVAVVALIFSISMSPGSLSSSAPDTGSSPGGARGDSNSSRSACLLASYR